MTAIADSAIKLRVKDTNITNVTVYQDRARVERQVTVPLTGPAEPPAEGKDAPRHHVRILDLPWVLQTDSVRVESHGPGVIVDVSTQLSKPRADQDDPADAERKQLHRRQEELYAEERRLQTQVDLVGKFAERATQTDGSGGNGDGATRGLLTQANVTAIRELVDYYGTSLADFETRLRDVREELAKTHERINELNGNTGPDPATQNTYDITVVLELPAADQEEAVVSNDDNVEHVPATANLLLTYMVDQASWEASYDIRAFTDTQKVAIHYMAQVRQNTGEAWEDVAMGLSTAQPSQGAAPPPLEGWEISCGQPRPITSFRTRAEMVSRSAVMPAMMSAAPPAGFVTKSKLAPPPAATVAQAGTANVTYLLPSRVTLPSDDQTHRVNIGLVETSAHLKYIVTPRLTSEVYLSARVENTSAYTLLPGEAAVFSDAAFVARTRLPRTVSPQEHFDCHLGTDASVRVNRLPSKRDTAGPGFLSQTASLRVTETVEVTNAKTSSPVCIVVQDQIPVSHDSRCKVTLIDPKPNLVKPARLERDLDSSAAPGGAGSGVEATAYQSPSASRPVTTTYRSSADAQATLSSFHNLPEKLLGRSLTTSARGSRSSTARGSEAPSPATADGPTDTTQAADALLITGTEVPVWAIDVSGGLLWSFHIPPRGKETVTFTFEVTHPASEPLVGI
ncbi:hypothetical protein IWQ60_008873 [Tieghemiomyces parasiticus]|uniref:Protein F37C4.5 n=1 Tax=Tieghemiomyces parasiticus TaxID=78921 RepID=A0A9W7ZUY7_9FUNG|nr:hypothetical protein IWQ60_008873 [Tieghemiomyces parasiticus]